MESLKYPSESSAGISLDFGLISTRIKSALAGCPLKGSQIPISKAGARELRNPEKGETSVLPVIRPYLIAFVLAGSQKPTSGPLAILSPECAICTIREAAQAPSDSGAVSAIPFLGSRPRRPNFFEQNLAQLITFS